MTQSKTSPAPRRRKPKVVSNEAIVKAIKENPAMVFNAMTTRADLMKNLFDPRRDIDIECGYPKTIDETQYRRMYDREMGQRVVNIYPEETWKKFPKIYEDADPDNETEFEASIKELDEKQHLLHYMHRVDELSGVGHYGIILWGLDDGLGLEKPVDGSETWEEATGKPRATPAPQERRIIYIRVLDESLCRIAGYETNPTNPRYGKPTSYTLTMTDPRRVESSSTVAPPSITETTVHWTRITHVADNRKTSEIIGTPRQEPVWNRLYDLRKILGGNGEMFWRGGFPGVALETQPGLEGAEFDEEATRKMMYDYANGLQRYIALNGMSAKSLAPQISEPGTSFETQVKAICIIIGVPYRVFMGIEEGVVSGDQATNAWDGRLANRQERYVTPMLINPIIQRLVDFGAVKPTAEPQGWTVAWPDLTAPKEKEKAEVASKRTDALAKYVQATVDTLVPPMEFLTHILGLEADVAEAILAAAIEHIGGIEDEDEVVPGHVSPGEEEPEGTPAAVKETL